MAQQKWKDWALFILLALVWGSSFIIMKKCSETLTGWQIGSTRIFAAGMVFLPFAFFHTAKIPARKLPVVFLTGIFGNLLPAFLFATAIEQMNSSLAGILNSLTPLFVIVIGILFFKTKIQSKKIVGVVIGFIGLLVLNLSRGPVAITDLGPVLMIILATAMYGLNVNLVGYFLKDVDGIRAATVSMSFVGIIAAFVMWHHNVFELIRHDEAALPAIGLAVLLGIVGSAIATALFYLLIQRAGTIFASLVTYAMPIVAIFWGLLANETVTPVQMGCLLLILVGVYIANRSR